MSDPLMEAGPVRGTRASPLRAIAPARAAASGVRTVVAVAVVLVGCLVVAWEARHSSFSGDDWTFILHRRGFSADVFLKPHNEHLSALPILSYKAILAVFGASSYVPFMALLLALHGAVSLLVYVIARRYVGPWVALAPAVVVVVLGPAWQDLLWAFQVGYLGSVAAGLGMVLCLERRDCSGDVGAGVLLGISLLCSSIGLAMVVLGAVLIALQRPLVYRRLWAVGAPLGLYLLWYAFYGVSTIRTSNIHRIPGYLFDAASAAIASVTGLGQTHVSPYLVSITYGRPILAVALGFFIVYLAWGGRPPALTWAALSAALVLWIAECLEYFPSGREANQSRYQYTGAVLVLLVAASAAKGWRPTVRSAGILGVAAAAVCAVNIAILNQRSHFWSEDAKYDRAETGALEVARSDVSPDFAPENAFITSVAGNHNLTVITAGPYFSAVTAFGSSAYRPTQILSQPENVRETADLVVASAEGASPIPFARIRRPFPCRSRTMVSGSGAIVVGPSVLTFSNAGMVPAQLELRRFGSAYRFLLWSIPGGVAVAARLPSDRANVPWHVRIAGGPAARLCVTGLSRASAA